MTKDKTVPTTKAEDLEEIKRLRARVFQLERSLETKKGRIHRLTSALRPFTMLDMSGISDTFPPNTTYLWKSNNSHGPTTGISLTDIRRAEKAIEDD